MDLHDKSELKEQLTEHAHCVLLAAVLISERLLNLRRLPAMAVDVHDRDVRTVIDCVRRATNVMT